MACRSTRAAALPWAADRRAAEPAGHLYRQPGLGAPAGGRHDGLGLALVVVLADGAFPARGPGGLGGG